MHPHDSVAQRISEYSPTVLVVDDDECTRLTTSRSLRNIGLSVVPADSGAAAIVAARIRTIDLALLDLRLPDMSGLQVIAALREMKICVPWILYSGWMTVPIAVEAMKLGAVSVQDLPFDIKAVVMPALTDLGQRYAISWPRLPLAPRLRVIKSATERWASFVLRGCDSEVDLRTLQHWPWDGVRIQRCTTHKRENLKAQCPSHARAEVKRDYDRIVYAEDGLAARAAYDVFVKKWATLCPAVAKSLQEAGLELLTFYAFQGDVEVDPDNEHDQKPQPGLSSSNEDASVVQH